MESSRRELPERGHVEVVHVDDSPAFEYTPEILCEHLVKGELPKEFAYVTSIEQWKEAAKDHHYYQTFEEKNVLETFCPRIINKIQPGAVLMDMGAGNTEKVDALLHQLDEKGVKYYYICVDLSKDSVVREVDNSKDKFKHVQVSGLVGTFQDGLRYLGGLPGQRICLWLGSTLFNNSTPSVSPIVQSCHSIMRSEQSDFMVVGQDCHGVEAKSKILQAYHSDAFRHFIDSSVEAANAVLGQPDALVRATCKLDTYPNHLTHVHTLRPTREFSVGPLTMERKDVLFFPSHKPQQEYFERILLNSGFDSTPLKREDNNSIIFLVQPHDLAADAKGSGANGNMTTESTAQPPSDYHPGTHTCPGTMTVT